VKNSARTARVSVSADGRGLVSQAGAVLLWETMRVTGLGRGLSQNLARWRAPRAVHDPGKVIADLAAAVALGGDCLADIAVLREQPELALVDLLRRHRGRNGVAIFAADEAPEDMTDGDLRLLAELFDLGLASAMRSDEENELSIFPPIGNAQEGDDGFGALLRTAMAANVDKLHEARPRERHLVVTLDRSDLSPDPVRTPAPELPDGIDVVGLAWLFQREVDVPPVANDGKQPSMASSAAPPRQAARGLPATCAS
jgi:hypothetical protein